MSEKSGNITIIENVKKEDLEELMPSVRYDWLRLFVSSFHEIRCFAMRDESKEIIAICVYTTHPANSKSATLLYINVSENYRNQNVATTLFFASLEQIKKWGYHTIEAIAFDEDENKILKKWGFPFLSHDSFMTYTPEILFSSKIVKSIEKLASIKKYVKKYNDLTQKEITDFASILNNGHHNDIEYNDHNLTRYYLGGNGKIIGYLPLISTDAGGTYVNTDLYIQKNENANIALPAMLADCLNSIKDIVNPSTRFILRISSKVNYNTMIQGFGKPSEEITAEVYSYNVRG